MDWFAASLLLPKGPRVTLCRVCSDSAESAVTLHSTGLSLTVHSRLSSIPTHKVIMYSPAKSISPLSFFAVMIMRSVRVLRQP